MEGQDNVNMNPTPTPTPNMSQPVKPVEGGVGPVIATIIILAVIVLGGLYFWMQRAASKDDTNPAPASTEVTLDTSAIDTQSSSDDTSSIDTDLKSTNTSNVDSSLNAS